MIVPADDSNDYTPVAAPYIQVGQEVVLQYELQGAVTTVIESGSTPGLWILVLDDLHLAYFADEPMLSLGDVFLYRRQAKPAQGTLFTAADGSRWVFPALPHGLYRCWQAGTVHGEGLADRSEIEGLVAD